MRLEQQHPSLAHLTFVAAIEGFGRRFVSEAPSDCSPGCTHRKNVAQKRFRKALKTVMTNREVEEIWQIAYTLRSFTGHAGTLFGSENTYGYSHYGSLGARGRTSCKRQVSGSNPLTGSQWSSRFGGDHFHVWV